MAAKRYEGRLLGEGRTYIRDAPWMAVAPGVVLTGSVMAVIGLSDAWRRKYVNNP